MLRDAALRAAPQHEVDIGSRGLGQHSRERFVEVHDGALELAEGEGVVGAAAKAALDRLDHGAVLLGAGGAAELGVAPGFAPTLPSDPRTTTSACRPLPAASRATYEPASGSAADGQNGAGERRRMRAISGASRSLDR
jgi:hypothetical protein